MASRETEALDRRIRNIEGEQVNRWASIPYSDMPNWLINGVLLEPLARNGTANMTRDDNGAEQTITEGGFLNSADSPLAIGTKVRCCRIGKDYEVITIACPGT